jgi:hypothetical protein
MEMWPTLVIHALPSLQETTFHIHTNIYKTTCILGFEVFTAVVLKSIIFWDIYSSTLKMEAIRSSETSGTTLRTTRRHIPEDHTLLAFLFSIFFKVVGVMIM